MIQSFQVREIFFATDFFQVAGDVYVLHIAFKAGRYQDVLVAVEIHIKEDRTPRPVRSRNATEIGNLRIVAISMVKKKRVARIGRPVVNLANGQDNRLVVVLLGVPLLVVSAQHVSHKNLVVAVPVQVRKIDTHGK